ncbi:MAG TPA: type 4a pilus biogenesis protein PilO [Acidimicrobiales bacterium]|nr:type 4a pilus biogenesis protein PilO [Acidimicrobiales bacterium]
MNRRALIFGAVGSVVLLLLWYFLLWSPRQAEIKAAQDRTAAAETQASSLEAEIQRLQEAQRDEPLKQARRAELQAAAPDDPALGQFILDVNAAAGASGIDFMTISQEPPAASESGGLSVITLSFSISGGYFQVLDFMNRLTDMPRLVVIDSVNLTPGEAGRLSASLGTRMFTTATGIDPTTTTTVAPGATTTTVAGSPPPAGGEAPAPTTTAVSQ